jgi:hypothetical protein
MGLSTWWLGPPSDPQLVLIQLLPFVGPVAMIVMAARHARFLPYWGAIAGIVVCAIATGDLNRFERLGLVELIVGAAGAAVSIASVAGTVRSVPGIDAPVP